MAGEKIVGEGCGVSKALKDRVQEAGVAEIVESGADGTRLRPGHLNLLLAEKDCCRQTEAIAVLCGCRGRGRGVSGVRNQGSRGSEFGETVGGID